jgi:acyl-CoA hydrolase
MSWVDIAAAICSRRHTQRNVVTASVDALSFLAPIRLGWIVTLQASVNYVWSSSCESGVKVTAENPSTGETFHTASAYVTMVALDSNGRPCKIYSLQPEGEDEQRRFEEAQQRRAARLKLKKEIASKRAQDD